MNSSQSPDTDKPVRDFVVSVTILAATLGGLLYVSEQSLTVAPPRRITLIWDDTSNPRGSFTTEVWASTNLTTWTLKTNIAGTNRVTLPADQSREFFKIRNRGTNGTFSDWSRKPTL